VSAKSSTDAPLFFDIFDSSCGTFISVVFMGCTDILSSLRIVFSLAHYCFSVNRRKTFRVFFNFFFNIRGKAYRKDTPTLPRFPYPLTFSKKNEVRAAYGFFHHQTSSLATV
jgi:hypothetical protein